MVRVSVAFVRRREQAAVQAKAARYSMRQWTAMRFALEPGETPLALRQAGVPCHKVMYFDAFTVRRFTLEPLPRTHLCACCCACAVGCCAWL
jgi:hypothetical protein